MRRVLDFRIVRWEMKVLYIAVAWIVGFVVAGPFRSMGAPEFVTTVVDLLINAAAFAFAVRIFRGADEPVEPSRAWWRMTAWPTLSRRLGILFAVLTGIGGVAVGLVVVGVPGTSLATSISGMLQFAVLAYLYLNSAARMNRLGIAKPEPMPKPVRLT